MDQQTPVPTLSTGAPLRPRREALGPVFSVAISRALGMIVVTVHGVLDAATSDELRGILEDLIHQAVHPDVVVDVRDMTVGDGADLQLFVDASHRARERGGRLALSEPSEAVVELSRRRAMS
jgi:anti-anti-sigma factor